ncbi:MAG: alpha/beta fold hydrolase, partial [Nocardioides sp.]
MSPVVSSLDFPSPILGGHGRSALGHFRNRAGFERFHAAYGDAFALLPPMKERLDLDTSFGRVRCYRFGAGSGTPLVLLPGRNASTPTWGTNLPSLSTTRTVYCLDSLGEAGASTQARPLASPDDQAGWVAEALSELGAGPVHLVGSSLGGWVALHVAIHHPESLRTLTVLDP